MANLASAKKAIRSSAKKAVNNLRHARALKDAKKDVLNAVKSGDKKKATELMAKAQKEIDKAAKTGVIKKNTAARQKSRLAAKVSALK